MGVGLVISITATSCVVPYDSTTETVTTYRPGYVAHTLPHGYRTEVVGGVSYYHHNGVYFRPHHRRGEYVVVDSPYGGSYHGDDRVIRVLPRGYQTVRRNGVVYYRSGDSYYQRRGDGHVIVELR